MAVEKHWSRSGNQGLALTYCVSLHWRCFKEADAALHSCEYCLTCDARYSILSRSQVTRCLPRQKSATVDPPCRMKANGHCRSSRLTAFAAVAGGMDAIAGPSCQVGATDR